MHHPQAPQRCHTLLLPLPSSLHLPRSSLKSFRLLLLPRNLALLLAKVITACQRRHRLAPMRRPPNKALTQYPHTQVLPCLLTRRRHINLHPQLRLMPRSPGSLRHRVWILMPRCKLAQSLLPASHQPPLAGILPRLRRHHPRMAPSRFQPRRGTLQPRQLLGLPSLRMGLIPPYRRLQSCLTNPEHPARWLISKFRTRDHAQAQRLITTKAAAWQKRGASALCTVPIFRGYRLCPQPRK